MSAGIYNRETFFFSSTIVLLTRKKFPRVEKAIGCSCFPSPCNNTAPIPRSDASVYNKNGKSWLGGASIGRDVNSCFNAVKALRQASVHSMMSGQRFFVRSDNSEEIALKFGMLTRPRKLRTSFLSLVVGNFQLMLSLPSVVISLLLRHDVLKNHMKGLQKHIWRAV